MSVNCIECVENKRTGSDLLCDSCRAKGIAKKSIEQLARSDRGATAIRDALIMLDNGGIDLDGLNQAALVQLLLAAWRCPGSVRDAMRDVVGADTPPVKAIGRPESPPSPKCAKCGHTAKDHRKPNSISFGCEVSGCDCRTFVPREYA